MLIIGPRGLPCESVHLFQCTASAEMHNVGNHPLLPWVKYRVLFLSSGHKMHHLPDDLFLVIVYYCIFCNFAALSSLRAGAMRIHQLLSFHLCGFQLVSL